MSSLVLGYNTNGLAFHRPLDALNLLADTGYRAVGMTLDHAWLDPFSDNLNAQVSSMARLLSRLGLRSVIETGARFLLNPQVKHEPTLLSRMPEERAVRIDFLKRAIDIAADLGSDAVSFWSGVLHDSLTHNQALDRLAAGIEPVVKHAESRGVKLAFEPEPGMWIDTLARFDELHRRIGAPLLGLTIDIGHIYCQNEGCTAELIRTWQSHLFNVHIEDMRRGVHEHLRFGEGEIDFPPILQALATCGYANGVYVELSRHSHMAPDMVAESYDFLKPQGRGWRTPPLP